ncbi:MBL fold metallo-hydrolase [Anaerolentibacter hominis]|uniref:MBL fold metallo-hydrolase n=1 Tax=Anaerolentibacter hominis TaxID=3079009 RepID=UPI0031B7FE7F
MELRKIADRVFYHPHQPETDRPMLAYLNGEQYTLAIDAGNSADHVEEFYQALQDKELCRPDFTVITHWHWDHTFGMHHVHGISLAHRKTNEYLKRERERLADPGYSDFLRADDEFLRREYENGKDIIIRPADLEFEESLTLFLGGLTARIFHTQSPHSEDSVLLYVPKEKILFLGDATSEDFYQGGYMDQSKLRALIRVIERTECRWCVLSHTEPLTKGELLEYLYSIQA